MWLENAHSLTSTVENQSLATNIPLYFSGGTRTLMGADGRGEGSWEGAVPLSRKNEFSPENGGYFGAF